MKKLWVLLLLAGCGGMNNDEIIAESQKCHNAGLEAKIVMNGLNQRSVWCEIPDHSDQPEQEETK